jgi:hypothetical protein
MKKKQAERHGAELVQETGTNPDPSRSTRSNPKINAEKESTSAPLSQRKRYRRMNAEAELGSGTRPADSREKAGPGRGALPRKLKTKTTQAGPAAENRKSRQKDRVWLSVLWWTGDEKLERWKNENEALRRQTPDRGWKNPTRELRCGWHGPSWGNQAVAKSQRRKTTQASGTTQILAAATEEK